MQFNDDKCLDAPQGDPGSLVEMITCHGLRGNQEWKHDKKKVNNIPMIYKLYKTNTQATLVNKNSGHHQETTSQAIN